MHTWGATGACFGAVVSPFSTGLYATFFVSPFGLIQSGKVVSGFQQHFYIEAVNSVAWGAIYGLTGYGIDIWLSRRRRS